MRLALVTSVNIINIKISCIFLEIILFFILYCLVKRKNSKKEEEEEATEEYSMVLVELSMRNSTLEGAVR